MIGHVYFIQEGSDGAIKIGWTKADPIARMNTLACGNSNKLNLLGWLIDHPDSEKAWHIKFKACRKHGEWFWPTTELVAEIRHALETHETPASRIVLFAEPITASELYLWIKKNKKTVSAFADEIGYSASYLGEYLRGGWVRMSPRLANRIETATGGELKALSLLRGATETSLSTDEMLQAVSA